MQRTTLPKFAQMSLVMVLIICSTYAFTSCDASPTNHVTVANVIPGSTIRVHCYSGDDDLGFHQLGYLEPLSWSFHHSALGNTKFFCTITTNNDSGNYCVYKDKYMAERCGLDCVWQVRADGPCLQQTHDVPWCQPWQN